MQLWMWVTVAAVCVSCTMILLIWSNRDRR